MSHNYRDDVRDLKNIIEHAFVLCPAGLIQIQHLPPSLCQAAGAQLSTGKAGLTLKALEALHISDALRRHGGNRKKAAKELGINPSTLFRKIRSFGIVIPEGDGRNQD